MSAGGSSLTAGSAGGSCPTAGSGSSSILTGSDVTSNSADFFK